MHTGLRDLFYALVKSQDHRPKIADSLQTDNDQLRQKLTDLRTEHNKLKQRLATFARVVHILEVETPNYASKVNQAPPSNPCSGDRADSWTHPTVSVQPDR
jgi:hypothetical protein